MDNRTALITGATSGIGEATAEMFAQHGINLILTGRRADRLDKVKQRLSQHKVRIDTWCFDVRDYDAVKQAVAEMVDAGLSFDILVNNAGLASGLDKLQNGSIDDWNKMIDTNVKGLLFMSREVIPHMVSAGKGHIVNIGSIAGKEVYPNGNVYCGTKHMVDALNRSMRQELAENGVKVSAVNPGAVETEFSIVRLHGDTDRAKQVYEGFANLVAADIADAVYYIISRPEHVNINDLIIMPKAQPAAGQVIRNKGY